MNPWLSQPDCDPFPCCNERTTMSDRAPSIWDPRDVQEVIDRLKVVSKTECPCPADPHMNALHDLATSDVPWLIDQLAEAERRGAEKGWDEGHKVGWEHCQYGGYGTDYWDDDTPNPYRKAAQ